jgi:hypothetical protein
MFRCLSPLASRLSLAHSRGLDLSKPPQISKIAGIGGDFARISGV